MKSSLGVALLVCCISIHGITQNPAPPNQPGSEVYEQWLLDLSRQTDTESAKGWKFLARFIHEQSIRSTCGQPADMRILFTETERLAFWKENNSTTLRKSMWSPVGPFSAPDPDDPGLIPGTGRINTITFHPSDANIMWIGGGQGGIWKSTTGGTSWVPLGDNLPVMRISDIAVNPKDPDEMYICIGDYAYLAYWIETADRKRNTHFGMGVYKTIDGGQTWEPTGLTFSQLDEDASLTRRVFIDPTDDNRLLAAGIHGIWESSDRGDSWNQVFDEIIWDIEADPANPHKIYASTGFVANLDDGIAAIWKSEDFGKTWTKLNTGIPETDAAQRIEISISPADSNTIYAVACSLNGGFYGLYRSTNGGASWTLRSDSPNILHWSDGNGQGGQGAYDLAILADPHDVNKVYVSGVNNWVSEDGGLNWHGTSYYIANHGPSVHADHHMLAYNPYDQMIYLCHDGGVSRTPEIIAGSWDEANNNKDYQWPTQWEHLNDGLANLSFYRLGVSQKTSGNVYAGAQDMGTFLRGQGHWTYKNLGDGMECLIHPENDDILVGSTQFGNVFGSINGGQSFYSYGSPWGNEFAAWTTPLQFDPADPDVVYIPASNVWRTDNLGQSFTKLSELDNIFPISAFSVSPADSRMMYLGKRVWYSLEQPGQLMASDDGGINWFDISSGTPVDSLYISFLETDDDNPLHLWACFGGFAEGEKVYESFDGGSSWGNISSNLPNLPANCLIHHDGIEHDPIYVGMDRGVFYRNDTMDHWMLYSEGLPNVIISDFDIHEEDQQLYISTFGRGVWVNNLVDNMTTATNDLIDRTAISIAPNPNSGVFMLRCDGLPHGEYAMEIVDVMGRTVHRDHLAVHGDTATPGSLPDLISGMYYLRLRVGGSMLVESFVVE